MKRSRASTKCWSSYKLQPNNSETADSKSRRSLVNNQPEEELAFQDASERHDEIIVEEEEITMKTTKTTYYRRSSTGSRMWNWTRKRTKRSTPLRRMVVKVEIEAECTAMVLVGEAPMAVPTYTIVGTNLVQMGELYYLSDANASSHMLAG